MRMHLHQYQPLGWVKSVLPLKIMLRMLKTTFFKEAPTGSLIVVAIMTITGCCFCCIVKNTTSAPPLVALYLDCKVYRI